MSEQERNKDNFLARYGSENHIDSLIGNKYFHDKEILLKNPSITAEQHEKLFNMDAPTRLKAAVAGSEGLPKNLRHTIMTHSHGHVRSTFARRNDITDEEFNHLRHDNDPNVIHALVDEYAKPNDSKLDNRVSDIIHNGPDYARSVVAKNHGLASHHVYDVLSSGDTTSIANVANHNVNLNPDHLKTLSDHPDFRVRGRLAMNRELPDHIREKLRNDPDENVRTFAKAYK